MANGNSAVLVVDDNKDVHKLFATLLPRYGLTVQSALTGEQALDMLKETTYDLVLLDVVMPGQGGLDTLRAIRKLFATEVLPVLIVSGYSDREYIFDALESGASDYLLKSLGMPIMIERMKMHLHFRYAIRSLTQLESRNREILHSVPDLIFRMNQTGEVLDLNRSPEGMLMQIFDGLHGAQTQYFLGPEIKKAALEFVAAKHPKGELEIKRVGELEQHRKKEARCFELRMVASAEGEAICIVRDVTANIQREKDLQELVGSDPLTRIPNRRRFSETLQREWKRQLRDKKKMSLAFLDVDHFKAFNDHYGHVEGDKCLINIANSLEQACMRSGDLPSRYGGEEFAVILPETDESGAVAVAERIRRCVEDLMVPHSPLVAPLARGGENWVTVSVGVATLVPGFAMTPEELVRRADVALYAAKRQGRNRVAGFSDGQ